MADLRQPSEELSTSRQWHAGEVELELGLVALAVAGAVEHRVDPGEDILGAEGLPEIATTVADESQFGGGCNLLDEPRIQVRRPAVLALGPAAEQRCICTSNPRIEVNGEKITSLACSIGKPSSYR